MCWSQLINRLNLFIQLTKSTIKLGETIFLKPDKVSNKPNLAFDNMKNKDVDREGKD